MKNTNEKKITTFKVFKVIMIIFTIIMVATVIQTIYGWATGVQDTNYTYFASTVASYCACLAIYEEEKKKAKKAAEKEAKKEEE